MITELVNVDTRNCRQRFELKRAMESFDEDSLHCPFCGALYKNPILLSCSHSICKPCVEKFVTFQKLKSIQLKENEVGSVISKLRLKLLREQNLEIPCPICQRITSLQNDLEAKSLRPNEPLGNLVEEFQASLNFLFFS